MAASDGLPKAPLHKGSLPGYGCGAFASPVRKTTFFKAKQTKPDIFGIAPTLVRAVTPSTPSSRGRSRSPSPRRTPSERPRAILCFDARRG